MRPEDEVKKLANEIVRLLKQHDNQVIISSALALVLGAWLVKSGDEDEDAEQIALLAAQAIIIAPTLRCALTGGDAESIGKHADEQLRKLHDDMVSDRVDKMPRRPVKKGPTPWGYDR